MRAMSVELPTLNSEKQRVFVRAYVRKGDAEGAAREADLSTQYAYRLLQKDHVQEAIQRMRDAAREESIVDAATVAEGLLREANYGHDDDKDDASHSARVRAWELLGEHLGLFDETRGDDAPDQVNIYQQINEQISPGNDR